jgi:hypothetical protein
MGWRSQDNYEHTDARDFGRLPWRERGVLRRVGWAVALVLVAVVLMGAKLAGEVTWPK